MLLESWTIILHTKIKGLKINPNELKIRTEDLKPQNSEAIGGKHPDISLSDGFF